ncbi:MAG: polysaccharide biosynthesis/export family protein [Luteolibacter sp.]
MVDMKSLLISIIGFAAAGLACAGEPRAVPVTPTVEPMVKTTDTVPGNSAPASPTSWRSRYELGPGDVINLSLFGRPELDRPGFRIAPDGTISYLQAQNIKVAGLSLDEARLAIEKSLASNFRSPRVIITPQEVASKRFTILGKVTNRGVVTLERPITLVEAIANAGGIETGLVEQNTAELADLDRSFITRNGQRLPVDFRKLLQEGDMKRNIEIEPNDFIYIASAISNDYYVLGAVMNPGVQTLTSDASVIAAITRRGGMTPRAWQDRVLIIRGSLDKPQTFAVNVRDILAAKQTDFKIEPKDIIYVADRPWADAEDIVKLALSAFVTSATANWINLNVDPIISR